MSHRGREIRGPDTEKLLPRVQGISVLCDESAGGRYAFDIGEQQTPAANGTSLNIAYSEGRACQGGQACRDFPVVGTPSAGNPNGRGRLTGPPKGHRFAWEPALADKSSTIAMSRRQHEILDLAKLADQRNACSRKSPRPRRRKGSAIGSSRWSNPSDLEANKDAVADRLNERAQPEQPSQQTKPRHREGCETLQSERTVGVPFRHRSDGSGIMSEMADVGPIAS